MKNLVNAKAPIFIHAGFRTSSTYALQCVEADEPLTQIYEPLHEGFSLAEQYFPRPQGSKDIFRPLELAMGGVAHFRKSFSTERLFLSKNDSHDPLKRYITALLKQVEQTRTRALIKEVRSQGRIGWIKHNFGGIHLGLIRNPRDQFRSYLWNARHSNWYFLAQMCQMFANNVMPVASAWTRQFVQVPIFLDEYFAEEGAFYTRFARATSEQDLYFIFMYLWFWNTACVINQADIAFELPLANEPSLNRKLQDFGFWMNVADYKASRAQNDAFESESTQDIEKLALNCLRRDVGCSISMNQTDAFLTAETNDLIEYMRSTTPAVSSIEGIKAARRSAIQQLKTVELKAADVPRVSIVPFTNYGHRLENDADTISRFGPSALYLGGGAALVENKSDGYPFIRFVTTQKGLACFGPHVTLPAGLYAVTFHFDLRTRSASIGQPKLFVEVSAERDAIQLLSEMSHQSSGRTSLRYEFRVDETANFVEPRLSVEDAEIRVFGTVLQKIG